MCTPRRARPTKRSETTSCRAAARCRASSASCSGGSERASSRRALGVLVPGDCRQLVGRAPGCLQRFAGLTPLRRAAACVQAQAATAPPCGRTRAPSPPAARRPSARTGGRRHPRRSSMSALATFSTPRNVARGAAAAWKGDAALTTRPRAIRVRMAESPACAPVLSTPVTTPGLAIKPSSAPRWVTRSASATTNPPRRSRASSAMAARSRLGPAETWSVASTPACSIAARTASSQSGRVIT